RPIVQFSLGHALTYACLGKICFSSFAFSISALCLIDPLAYHRVLLSGSRPNYAQLLPFLAVPGTYWRLEFRHICSFSCLLCSINRLFCSFIACSTRADVEIGSA
ncbi:unnamed protein product, partial [Ectocarpus sp. 12 AP-2014]